MELYHYNTQLNLDSFDVIVSRLFRHLVRDVEKTVCHVRLTRVSNALEADSQSYKRFTFLVLLT